MRGYAPRHRLGCHLTDLIRFHVERRIDDVLSIVEQDDDDEQESHDDLSVMRDQF